MTARYWPRMAAACSPGDQALGLPAGEPRRAARPAGGGRRAAGGVHGAECGRVGGARVGIGTQPGWPVRPTCWAVMRRRFGSAGGPRSRARRSMRCARSARLWHRPMASSYAVRASSSRPARASSSARAAGSRWPGSVQSVEQPEPGQRAVRLGDGHRPVEPDHGGAGQLLELAVAVGDPRPVRGRRRGAMACSAAISACRRYGAGGASASGVSSATASSISSACHRARSWSGEQHHRAVVARGRRAGSAGAASARAARRARSVRRTPPAAPRAAPAPAGSPRAATSGAQHVAAGAGA